MLTMPTIFVEICIGHWMNMPDNQKYMYVNQNRALHLGHLLFKLKLPSCELNKSLFGPLSYGVTGQNGNKLPLT